MSITAELTKLKRGRALIRRALQCKNTGLTTQEGFTVYPPYLQGMSDELPEINTTGMDDYTTDSTSIFTTSVNLIRNYAFYNYTTLKHLVLTSTTKVTLGGKHVFDNTPIEDGTGMIHVPASLLAQYQADPYWSKYTITSAAAPTETTKYLVEHMEHYKPMTVELFNSLTLEKIQGIEF